jgi:hypothetical protein
MNKFFIQLITANSGVSSKRFISLCGTLLLSTIIVLSFCGINVPDIAYYTISGVILGVSGMTLAQTKNTSETTSVPRQRQGRINTPNE